MVKVRSYGRYDVNGFWFRSTAFEGLHPLAATTNSWVVMRAIDDEGCKTNYYGIINKILEFSFAGNKEFKIVFFDCDWFDSNSGIQQNHFIMVEVKHNKWLRASWVVHNVNPREWLHTSGDAGYHDTLTLMRFIKKKSHHPLSSLILVQDSMT
jgi:hypothetical protein